MLNNKDFYPTPKELIAKMLNGVRFDSEDKVLEPSAGKGDIVDYITSIKHLSNDNIHCIESDYNLQEKLKKDGRIIISNDFLKYNESYMYNYIIMNPPFRNAEDHLFKAIEIGNGAEIICLLPAGSIESSNSEKRKLLQQKLKKMNASVEYLGTPFIDAERKTKVRTYVVKVKTEKREGLNFDFQPKDEIGNINVDFEVGQQLMSKNNSDEVFLRYKKRIEIFKKILLLSSELDFYSDTENPMVKALQKDKDNNSRYNEYIEKLKEGYWKTILNKFDIDYLLTAGVRSEWQKLRMAQSHMEFSKENVENFILELTNKESEIINQCVLASFDTLTKFNVKNSEVVSSSKFKTNSEYKINKKNIIPYVIESYGKWSWISTNYYAINKIKDIERGICFISDYNFNDIKSCVDAKVFNIDKFGVWQDSTFFELKLFKKGTMHLKWKDGKLLNKFNLKVNQLRADLPNKN